MRALETEIGGLRVSYLDEGSGDCVLLLPGWGAAASVYGLLTDHLKRSFRVVAPDMPGTGGTDEPREPWDASDYARFAEELLLSLGITRAAVIGHSNGGRTAIRLAGGETKIEIPKLVLIDSAGLRREKTAAELRREKGYKLGKKLLGAPPVRALFPDALEKLKRSRGSEDYRNASPVMRDTLVKLVNSDLSEYLPRIKQPALLIWGDRDDATPIEDGRRMEKLLPDGGLVTVAGAGHYSFLEQPGLVLRVLDSFLGVKA